MNSQLSVTLVVAMKSFQAYAVGDSIEARFKNCILPQHVSEACFMTTNEDEQFRAAVGAVMLSYGEGTEEFRLIEAEMANIQKFSAYITAASAGLDVQPPEFDESTKPLGLLGLWNARSRR